MRWTRFVFAIVVLLVGVTVAPAYTIVLRDGERVEIGEFYWLSGSTVTWVTPRGERRTVDLARLNLDATAHHNGEAVSEFIDRAIRRGAVVASNAPAATAGTANRDAADEPITITSADLATYREERERAAAEHPSSPSVLPPVGTPHDDARAEEEAANIELRWRDEARQLRGELDAEQAQIDALSGELAYREANPRKFRLSNEYNYGRGAVFVDRRGRYSNTVSGYSNGSSYNRADDEFAQLSSRLIDLQIQHRGTQSRWDTFVERARRAGVPPGWLRD